MSKKKGSILIFATFLLSCTATILIIVSQATESWVTSDLLDATNPKKSYTNYGLFTGVFENNNLATSRTEKIYMTCVFSENICGLSKERTAEAREAEIKNILNDPNCKKSTKDFENNSQQNYINLLKHKLNVTNLKDIVYNSNCNPTFINSGLYVTTLVFLSYTIFMGAVTAIVSVMNTSGNPISPWLNIWGLYIWNGLAAVGCFLTMVMWGAQFDQFIKKNVGITETLRGQLESDPSLGYSYWLIFLPLFLHLANIGILYYRQYQINKEPATPTLRQDHQTDGMIFVY